MDLFWAKIEKTDTCWLWTAGKNSLGYGRFLLNGKNRYAHRIAYEIEHGPVPSHNEAGERLVLDHLCRNPACCRPDHMEVVTHAENIRRGRNIHREKTECRNGHPYDDENTYITPDGERHCRQCVRDAGARYRARQRHERLL